MSSPKMFHFKTLIGGGAEIFLRQITTMSKKWSRANTLRGSEELLRQDAWNKSRIFLTEEILGSDSKLGRMVF